MKNNYKKKSKKIIDEDYFKNLYKLFIMNIRVELLAVFMFSILISFGSFYFLNETLEKSSKKAYVTYENGINKIESDSQILRNIIVRGEISRSELDNLESYYRGKISETSKIMIISSDGSVIYSNFENPDKRVDIFGVLVDEYNSKLKERDKKVFVIPLNLSDLNGNYLYYEDIPIPEVFYSTEIKTGNRAIGIISALIIFFATFLIITRSKIEYINEISESIKVISKGNLSYKIKVRGYDEVSSIAENINLMSNALKRNEDEKAKAEMLKNQLITNVSHDLRTPLTSIMGYLGLVRDGRYSSEEELEKYVGIAYVKSERLKKLIEDLFEYTKYSGDEVVLNYMKVNIGNLIEQVVDEFIPVFEENGLEIELRFNSKDNLEISIDPDKIVRVMDNLFMNIIKYSDKPSIVSIVLEKTEKNINLIITNSAKTMNNESVELLFDRFYKTDMSRSSDNNGSGLGLAITKSIINLHNGEIYASLKDQRLSIVIEFPLK